MRKGKLKKALALALTGAVIIGAFAGCGAKKDSSSDTKKEETKKIVIGASPSPHADILKVAKKELKKEKNFFKITKTNKRSNINIISCNNCSTSYFSKCNNKHSI